MQGCEGDTPRPATAAPWLQGGDDFDVAAQRSATGSCRGTGPDLRAGRRQLAQSCNGLSGHGSIAGKDSVRPTGVRNGRGRKGQGYRRVAIDHPGSRAPHPRPVWVVPWGGAVDLAQALWLVIFTRSSAVVARFVARLRLHLISDQDNAGLWVRAEFSGFWWMTSVHAFGDYTLAIWTSMFAVEGDTPSFLNLISYGRSAPEYPDRDGWAIWKGIRRLGALCQSVGYDRAGFGGSADRGVTECREVAQGVPERFRGVYRLVDASGFRRRPSQHPRCH